MRSMRAGLGRIAVVAGLLAAAGCALVDEEAVQIRVENASALRFDVVTLAGTPLGAIEAGARTEYRIVDVAYRFETVMVQVGDHAYGATVIDHVGETPLEGGRYTYVLDLVGGSGPEGLTLTVTLRDD